MTTTQFCHWFHGFLTLENPEFISAAQTQIIKDHLALVFDKVTPNYHSPKIKGGVVSGSNENTLPVEILDGESAPFDLEKYNREKDFNDYALHSPKTSILGISSFKSGLFDSYPPITGHPPFNILSENLDQSTISPSQIHITC